MKLSYRGQSYCAPVQPISGIETGLQGCFRGSFYRLMHCVQDDRTLSAAAYQFRGVSYLK